MTIAAIDFGRLYSEHLAAAARKPKPASEWDSRASEMKYKSMQNVYVDQFVSHMNLTGSSTLLDIGCGPGTICLAVANRLKRVIGLDYSLGMLDALMKNAADCQLNNVEALHLSWEDDWSEVPECDIVVASRSTTVQDMATALAKLNAKARQRVYLTHLVGGRFVDPAVIQVLGRKLPPLPDYIYIINILHGMGIHPRLDYIENESRLAGTANFDEFISRVAWSLGDLTTDERARLRAWYENTAPGHNAIGPTMRWALVSWDKS